jgi:hypothetical protein
MSSLVVLECYDRSIFLVVHFTHLESCHQTVRMTSYYIIRKLPDYIVQHTMRIKIAILESSLNTCGTSSYSSLLKAMMHLKEFLR